jgi:hypothetical protein
MNGGYQFVPHPGKQLLKLFWTAKSMNGRDFLHQATALSIAFFPTFAGFPLMQHFLWMHNTTRNPKYTFDSCDHYMYSTCLTTRVRDVDWKRGFMVKYDLPFTALDIQLPKEKIRGIQFWHHPIVNAMLKYEHLDPDERPGNFYAASTDIQ